MTPAARVQAAIEVLDTVLTGTPAEKALTGWARRARFAGSKDRRAIRDHVYQALRCRRSYAALGGALSGRGLMIGALRAKEEPLDDIFSGQGYGPAALTDAERQGADAGADPMAGWNLPDWLIGAFRDSLQDQAFDVARALSGRAPVMLRVNLRKCTREQALDLLQVQGIHAAPHPISATALVVTQGAPQIASCPAYRDGLVELQDGSSQAAMEVVSVPEGARVLDYCAGGGGKTLALAACADAQWFAHDVEARRMADLPARAQRAGVDVTLLSTDMLVGAGPFDIILCDVPCSGSGTWRRSPDFKWTLTEAALAELVEVQGKILQEAASLLRQDGQLIYTTCSVLRAENDDQIERFIAKNSSMSCGLKRCWMPTDGGDGFYLAHLMAE